MKGSLELLSPLLTIRKMENCCFPFCECIYSFYSQQRVSADKQLPMCASHSHYEIVTAHCNNLYKPLIAPGGAPSIDK